MRLGSLETEVYLPDKFPTQESAIEAAIKAGRQKIDVGFERGSEVVNGWALGSTHPFQHPLTPVLKRDSSAWRVQLFFSAASKRVRTEVKMRLFRFAL